MQRAWGGETGQHDVWPTRRQALLLQAALLQDERADAAWRDIRPHVEIAALDGPTLALLPTLRRNLIARGIEDELLNLFKGVHRYTWARSQRLMAAVLPTVARLEEAGIPTMLLKGAAFIAQGELDAGQRAIGDVDVLVPTEQRADAVALLGKCGFAPVDGVVPWYVTDYVPHYSPSYGFADADNFQLDLHWHVLHGSAHAEADADFWAASSRIELLGVPTRVLCLTDEILHVITHGLRWNALPTYRWVLDATTLMSQELGVDYRRLVDQAVKHRLSAQLLAGLSYLQQTLGVQIPGEVMSQLRRASRSRIERLELRALMRQPRQRRWYEQLLLYHEQYLRHEVAPGQQVGIGRRVRLECRRLGVRTPLDLPRLKRGGVPGPGRPTADSAAAVGNGVVTDPPPLVAMGTISFADPDVLRHSVLYGTWRQEGDGCWIAGREARIVTDLPTLPRTPAALSISADTHLSEQELTVIANDHVAGTLPLAPGAGLRNASVLLDPRALAGKRSLDFRLRCRRAASLAMLGTGDDDRLLGVFLLRIALVAPEPYEIGRRLTLVAQDEPPAASPPSCLFLVGWHEPEREGRWTDGLARLYLRVIHPMADVDLEFDARPYLGSSGAPLRFTVYAGGRRLARLSWGSPDPQRVRVPIPRSAVDRDGGLILTWRTANPRSPRTEGESTDARTLGLMMSSLALVER
ncbi:MAG TPA: nucleotidyltransferase family protein [Solirubrobacteraceae bacterium]|nr:nucleotidyltransferase family protein [Solirubrobacteraceae bacterium]